MANALEAKDANRLSNAEYEPLMVALMNSAQRAEYLVGFVIWLAALIYFWAWWLDPVHYAGASRYIMATSAIAWVTLLPAYFIAIFYRARVPSGPLRLAPGSRIAMVATKAPSEPFDVVSVTLQGMLAQDVPHDT